MTTQQHLPHTSELSITQLELKAHSLSDESLVIAVCHGDQNALEQLYERNVRRCFGLALRIVGQVSIAEEIVQEVFTRFWCHPDSFSPERGYFSTWILTVVRNKSVDILRQENAQYRKMEIAPHLEGFDAINSLNLLPDREPSPFEYAWTEYLRGEMRHALHQLPTRQYEVIALAYFGNLSQQEIADKLQQPLGTVKTRTRAALRQLRAILPSLSINSE